MVVFFYTNLQEWASSIVNVVINLHTVPCEASFSRSGEADDDEADGYKRELQEGFFLALTVRRNPESAEQTTNLIHERPIHHIFSIDNRPQL